MSVLVTDVPTVMIRTGGANARRADRARADRARADRARADRARADRARADRARADRARADRARADRAAAPSVGLRLTGRGRVAVATLAMVGATWMTFASQQAFAGSGAEAVPVGTRTVVAGETLWQIAGEYAAPGQDVRDVVADLIDLNALPDGGLRAGQELLVPAP